MLAGRLAAVETGLEELRVQAVAEAEARQNEPHEAAPAEAEAECEERGAAPVACCGCRGAEVRDEGAYYDGIEEEVEGEGE